MLLSNIFYVEIKLSFHSVHCGIKNRMLNSKIKNFVSPGCDESNGRGFHEIELLIYKWLGSPLMENEERVLNCFWLFGIHKYGSFEKCI